MYCVLEYWLAYAIYFITMATIFVINISINPGSIMLNLFKERITLFLYNNL